MSYNIISRHRRYIEECNTATSEACGSLQLGEEFGSLLRLRLGVRATEILNRRRTADTLRHFDTFVKRQFNPYDRDCDQAYDIPIAGAPDVPEIGLEEG